MSSEFFSVMLTQVGPTAPASSFSVWRMVLNAGLMVQLVMVLLLMFSVVCWAIIIFKALQLGRARRESYLFLNQFWKSRSLAGIYNEAGRFESSPVAQIFRVGYQELTRLRKSRSETRGGSGSEPPPLEIQGMENVERALRRAIMAESTRLSRALTFLATTANTTPFIGLFGTVWGIMGSFHEIGLTGAANLATVAPGISEALVATAAGLAAAIPAVVAFNQFTSRVRVLETEMTNFVSDFLNILERDLLKRAGV